MVSGSLTISINVFVFWKIDGKPSGNPVLDPRSQNFDFFLPFDTSQPVQPLSVSGHTDIKACKKLTRIISLLATYNGIDTDPAAKQHQELLELNLFISRLMFCLFAEDTGIFKKNQFTQALAALTERDGSDCQEFFRNLFAILNTQENSPLRDQLPLAKRLREFPYVNGSLFRGNIAIPKFNEEARKQLLNCGRVQWDLISPAIFGALFQAAMDPDKRRQTSAKSW